MNIDVSFKKGNSNIGAQIKQEDKSFVVDFSKNEAGFDIKSSNEESSFLAELSQAVRQVPAEFSEKIIVIGQYTDNPIIVKLQQTNDGVLITVTDKTGVQYGVIKNGQSGDPGYTPVKGVDYFDGESGKDGVTPHIGSNGNWHTGEVDTGVAATGPEGKPGADGSHGKDGYTPVKGVDYFDGKDGKDGVDGYTPQKGIDYFDGEPFTYEDLTEEQILELKGADSWNSLKDKPFGDENVQRYCTIVDHQWSANQDFSDVYFQYETTELNGYTIGNGFSGGEEVNVVINDAEYSGVVFTDESYSCVGDSAYTTVPFYIISSEIDARCVIKIKPDLVPAKVTVYRDVVEIKTIDPKYLPEGTNGVTPHVGDNGNWFVGDTDTGKPSRGAPGKDGIDGKDGYTPVKGVDYFDGVDGQPGEPGKDGVAGQPGKDGKDGSPGADGKDGYTPQKGVDYWTDADVAEIVNAAIAGTLKMVAPQTIKFDQGRLYAPATSTQYSPTAVADNGITFNYRGGSGVEEIVYPITGLIPGRAYSIVFDETYNGGFISDTYRFGCGIMQKSTHDSTTFPSSAAQPTYIQWHTGNTGKQGGSINFTAASDTVYWVWNLGRLSDGVNVTISINGRVY